MIIRKEQDAPTSEVTGDCARTLKVLLSPLLDPGLTSIAAGLSILPAGSCSDEHAHVEGEMFYIISGKGRIRVGAEEQIVEQGVAVWGQPYISHSIVNDSNDVLKVLWVLCPPGREDAIIKARIRTYNC